MLFIHNSSTTFDEIVFKKQSHTCNNNSVFGVSAPALKELPGQAGLHHARGSHDHARPDVLKVIYALELRKSYRYLMRWQVLDKINFVA